MTFLLGRQAMLGQDPPIYRLSMTAVRFPCGASVQARSLPAAPLPRTTTSYSSAADKTPSSIGYRLAPRGCGPSPARVAENGGSHPADRQRGASSNYRAADTDMGDVGGRPPCGGNAEVAAEHPVPGAVSVAMVRQVKGDPRSSGIRLLRK